MAVVALVGAGLAPLAASAAPKADTDLQAGGWSKVPAAAEPTISATLGAQQPEYRVQATASGYATAGSGRTLDARFGRGGVTVGNAGATLGLGLTGVGRGSELTPVAAVTPIAASNRVEYSYPGVTQWFANGPLGLEQGFTVARAPAAAVGADAPLTVSMSVSGDLKASLTAGGRAAAFSRSGWTVLSYKGLAASDATGRPLSSWLALDGNRLVIQVDDAGAAYPVRIDPLIEEATLTSSPTSTDYFGLSVAVAGDVIAVGAPDADSVEGDVDVFTEPSGGWSSETQVATLVASDGYFSDDLGVSVAISADGSTIVAGAPQASNPGNDDGDVYVFTEPSGGWSGTIDQSAELTVGAEPDYEPELGCSVAISGTTIVAGAPGGCFGTPSSGPTAVYVYTEPSGGWGGDETPLATLTTDDSQDAGLGFSVAISGSTVVSGAPDLNNFAGGAYLWTKPSGGWSGTLDQTAQLAGSDLPSGAEMGEGVAVAGGTVAVGVPSYTYSDGSGSGSGVVFLYAEPSSGWTGTVSATGELYGSDGGGGLGQSVAISPNGSTIVAGAPYYASGQGAAYVFTETTDGWTLTQPQSAELNPQDSTAGAWIGFGVAISADGTIVVGAPAQDSSEPAATYVFQSQPGPLTQTSNTTYLVTQGQIQQDIDAQGPQVTTENGGVQVIYTTTKSSPYLSVDPDTGLISASESTPTGDYTVSGTDSGSFDDTGTWSVEIQVGAAPVDITPGGSTLPGTTVGAAYSQQFTANEALGPYTWSVTAGALPTGLTLTSGGLLSGTPTTEGHYSFTITATASAGYSDSVATSLAVAPASLAVTPSSLPGAVSGYPYSTDLGLSGGVGTATFSLATRSLPAGLSMSSAGVISGTPSGSGPSSFSVTGTDGDGFSTTASYQVLVEASPTSAGITISPSTLPTTAIGSYYDQQLTASGGTGPYSWVVSAGEPPEGYAMTSGGLVHGHWNEGESGQFTVTATDSTGAATVAVLDMVVQSQGVVISPAALAEPTIDYGQSDPQVFTASGGTAPYSWQNVGGSLPSGMSLSLSDGTLTLEGSAQQSGTFTFTLNVIDAYNNAASQTYTLTVNPPPTITVHPVQLPNLPHAVGQPYSVQLTATGGTKPYEFSVEIGALPVGYSLTQTGPSTAVLSGAATLADADQSYDFQIEAEDANSFAGYQNYGFYIPTPTIKLSPTVLPDPVSGEAYDQQVSASGGGAPYNYAVTGGSLPAGLSLDTANGEIFGTPTALGPAKFTITATDINGYTKAVAYKVAVLGAPSFTSPAVAVAKEGLANTKVTVATTGSYPAPLMLISGSLPAGLTFTDLGNGTATITGTTTAAPGSYTVTVTADNRATGDVAQSITIWVYSKPLLPASKVFYPGEHSKYTITTQIPADLITITGEPSWVTITAGTKPDQLVVSGTPPEGTSVGTYPTTVTVTGLAPHAKPPAFNIIVGA
jgi:hypothetical protein